MCSMDWTRVETFAMCIPASKSRWVARPENWILFCQVYCKSLNLLSVVTRGVILILLHSKHHKTVFKSRFWSSMFFLYELMMLSKGYLSYNKDYFVSVWVKFHKYLRQWIPRCVFFLHTRNFFISLWENVDACWNVNSLYFIGSNCPRDTNFTFVP